MKALLAVFLLFVFSGNAFPATLEGKVFSWETMRPLNGAIIDFNSTPKQRIVSENGNYFVSLATGDYEIQAIYYLNGKPGLYALEEIQLSEEGSFVFDLILFPVSEEDKNRLKPIEGKQEKKEQGDYTGIIAASIAIALIIAIALLAIKKQKIPKQEQGTKILAEEKIPETEKKLPALEGHQEKQLDKYTLEVIDALKRSGNRLTQKELREKVSVGEAKVSLIVAELEQLGIVKKIKRGRGNIIILKKEN